MQKSRSRFLNSLPHNKQSLLFFTAFTLFYTEDFNIFTNAGIVDFCFAAVDTLPFRPLYFSLSVTLCGFVLLMLLYRWRLFAISEGRDLIVCCGLIICGPLLWLVAPYVSEPLPVSLAGLALITFGHLCFLPRIVKNLADIGVAQSLVSYACVLVVSTVLRPVLFVLPDPALAAYLVISPVAMTACLQFVERNRTRPVELRKDSELRIPRALFVTMVAIGVLAGLRTVAIPGTYLDRFIGNTIVLVVASAIAVYMALFRKMNFNRLIYLIGFPMMVLGLVIALSPGSLAMPLGNAVYLLGYHTFYAVIWALYSYLVRFSSFNYYWLPITAAVGGFAGRFFSVMALEFADEYIDLGLYLPFIASVVVVLVMTLAVFLCSQNNMKSGWGSIAPGNDDFILDSFERNCMVVAKSAGLTPRESDVLQLLARGRNRQYIAENLVISEGTAKTHIKHVYRKVGVHSQQELIDVVEQSQKYTT